MADVTITDYSKTQDFYMVRPDITRMDFTVKNLSAGKVCDKIKVTTDTVGITMK